MVIDLYVEPILGSRVALKKADQIIYPKFYLFGWLLGGFYFSVLFKIIEKLTKVDQSYL